MKSLIRRTIGIDYTYRHNHLPGSLSALPIIADIYESMNIVGHREDGARVQDFRNGKDIFILSKGHAAAAWYAVLETYGYKPHLENPHPERDPENGVTATTGSLGHGLPMAVGIALAKQLKGESGIVHVLLGDGECAEGTTWESILLAGAWKLDNLKIHVDGNGCGCLADVPTKTRIIEFVASANNVLLVWHKTVKGFGVKSIEGTKDHVMVKSLNEIAEMLNEVEAGGRFE